MIEWNRDAASIIQLLQMVIFFILLLVKRNKLGKGISYFIIASGILIFADMLIFAIRISTYRFNSVPIYTIGTSLVVFLMFFLYFHDVLELKKSKKLNLILTGVFLICYALFVVFSENFFTKFSLKFYIIEVLLLLGNIYLVLYETFNSNKILNIKSYYPFWICIGLMSIYLGVIPLMIIRNTAMEMMNINIFFIILFIVNILGYSILITGIFFARNINLKK
ncbi:hypothetical protein [Kaistella sp.]|uniref:hypothetical protein n=1 Tax=Kaistella sp. TaxID=2782235 RepID=UPI003C406090